MPALKGHLNTNFNNSVLAALAVSTQAQVRNELKRFLAVHLFQYSEFNVITVKNISILTSLHFYVKQ